MEYYPDQEKVFLLDLIDQAFEDSNDSRKQKKNQNPDEQLVQTIRHFAKGSDHLGVSVPLSLPPCIPCRIKNCPFPKKCTVPQVRWMRESVKKAKKNDLSEKHITPKEFTPYTQRPIELWMRYFLFPQLPENLRFEIDETLGGTRAPLSARMIFLKKHLKSFKLYEVLPKLTLALVCKELSIPHRFLSDYRDVERGVYARKQILEYLVQKKGVFIYQKDLSHCSKSLNSFNAFLCAYTAFLEVTKKTQPRPKNFPKSAHWLSYPKMVQNNG